jgi:hypothetical protein
VLWMDVIVTGIEVEEKAVLDGKELRVWVAPSESRLASNERAT